jgi:hypothetical protein
MKKIFLFLLTSLLSFSSFAQNLPQGIAYQAVAVKEGPYSVAGENPQAIYWSNKDIKVRFTILDQYPNPTDTYQEFHPVTTDDYGVFNLIIGQGTIISGDFETIPWELGTAHLQVEIDFDNDDNYTVTSFERFWTVPYAFVSKKDESINIDSAIQALNDKIIYLKNRDQDTVIGNEGITYKTIDSLNQVLQDKINALRANDLDTVVGNEIQTLAIKGDSLSISDGNTVKIDFPANLDNDSTNEIQSLTIKGDSLSISDGNIVKIDFPVKPDEVWSLGGNSGTNDSIHFIGTTDGENLNFRVNNKSAGRIDHQKNNVFFGNGAGQLIINGTNNTAIGSNALANNKNGNSHIAIGNNSMFNMTPDSFVSGSWNGNIGIGNNSLREGVKGYQNYGIGNSTLRNTLNGIQNIAIGEGVLMNTKNAIQNIGIGYRVLDNTDSTLTGTLVIGHKSGRTLKLNGNLIIGHNALFASDSCEFNTAVGSNTMEHNKTGSFNVTLGKSSLRYNRNGNHNTAIGYSAGGKNKSGNFNLFIGNYADATDTSLVRASAIGYNAKVSQSNSMVLGGIGLDAINVGIGVTAPARTLHIKSVMRLEPLSSPPANPSEGDIYMDGTSHKLKVFDGNNWQACW